jgi:hypothetical protein
MNAQYMADKGFAVFKVSGKVPAKGEAGWQNKAYTEKPVIKGGYGVVLKDTDLVVDVDPRNFVEGDKTLSRLCDAVGLKLQEDTFTVKTGGGGYHIYYKVPKGSLFKETHPEYKGIEFKSKGRYVVGPGSIHPDTKKKYEIINDSEIQMIPEILLNMLPTKSERMLATSQDIGYVEDINSCNLFRDYLKTAEIAVEGERGDEVTFKTACRGRDFGLSPAKTAEIMLSDWNDRCEPPWNEEDIAVKVRNAYEYNTDIAGKKNIGLYFEEDTVKDKYPKWVGVNSQGELKWELAAGKKGELFLKKSLRNAVIHVFLEIYGMIKHNAFSYDIVWQKYPEWLSSKCRGSERVMDNDIAMLRFELSKKHGVEYTEDQTVNALEIVANKNSFHPIRDYLESVKWDKIPRIDTWLVNYFGVENSIYTRAVGSKTLIAAVKRVFEPGCKHDYVLVLEGEQGSGKTTAVGILGDPWAGRIELSYFNKDSIDKMRGNWIIEVPELVCSRKAEMDKLKATIDEKTDRARLAYKRHTEDFPRQSIFIGTINPEKSGEYLKDQTGNRRFWPVKVTRKLKFAQFEAIRDQLWAEALFRYKTGNITYLTPQEEILAQKEVEKRRTKDPACSLAAEFLRTPNPDGGLKNYLTVRDIWSGVFYGNAKDFSDRRNLDRVYNIMQDIGWGRKVISLQGMPETVFVRPLTEEWGVEEEEL